MRYRLSILNIAAVLYIISCIIFIFLNYTVLSENEGWGIIAMLSLFAFGFVFLGIDYLMQRLVKNRKTVNIAGLIIVVLVSILYITA